MRLLVTGASGFAGTYLCRRLCAAGHEVVALAASGQTDLRVDVRDREEVLKALAAVTPEGVFHLAGVAFVPDAERDAEIADQINRGGTANVLDGAFAVGARTVVVSSGAVYGRLRDADLPAAEDTPLRPLGAYACSKAAAEQECRSRTRRQEIVVIRPFNHTGPGQMRGYVCSDFSAQLAECEAGLRPPSIEVGDLAAERDFCDVRDVVDAYLAVYERARAGAVYNVCSGTPVAVGEVLKMLVSMARVNVRVISRAERLRPGEVNRFYGSNARIAAEIGWCPRIPLQQTLRELLDDWRARVSAS